MKKITVLALAGALLVPALAFSIDVETKKAIDATQVSIAEIDAVRVKKAIADSMTPTQLDEYKIRMARGIKYRQQQKAKAQPVVPMTANDVCTSATFEISALPFNGPADTTVGMTDNYKLPPDTTTPTCTGAGSCTGAGPAGSLPAGAVYTGTGTGPDKAYKIRTDANCTLTITMDPTSTQDLGLIVYQTQCSNLLTDCLCADDTGAGGVAESVTLSAIAGTDYYIVIDGYSTSAVPPGPSGPFTLTVAGSGCSLVPVSIQKFTAE